MSFIKNSPLASIGKLYRIFNHTQRKRFIWLVILTFVGSVTDLLGLALIIPVIGLVLAPTSYSTLITYMPFLSGFSKNELLLLIVGVFLVLIIAKNAFGLYINKLQVDFVQNLYVTSSMNVLEKIYNRSLIDLQQNTSNELVGKLSHYQSALCSSAAISTIIIINEAIVFTLTAITVCVWDWKLFFLLIGVLLPIMGTFYARVKNMIRVAGDEKSKNSVKLYSSAQEMIFGYTDIKIAGTENSFKYRFKKFATNYSKHQARMDFMLFIPTRIIEIAIFMCITLILLYGVFVLKDLEKIISTVSLFSMIAYRSIPSVNRFVMAISTLNGSDFVFRDPDFVQQAAGDDNTEPVKTSEPIHFSKNIRFDNVSYQYPGGKKNVIKDCGLEIKRGEKIGIVGKSGAGKSTLIGNILGFLHPTEGNIYIDNTVLDVTNTPTWWKILGYVRQEVFIMNTTFIENIAIGEDKENIDMARFNHALELASLKDLVADWPEGIYTQLNERGNNLSGGQKQRIAIARAIYKGAQVLVFDEATSALDSKTEEEITNAIRELGHEDLTIIIIAHRYTSLKYCDKIYQLDKGEISEAFTYAELMSNDTKQTQHK